MIVHHLGRGQSERVVWLCEELALEYELRRYERDEATMLAPPALKALHPIGSAPLLEDGGVLLAESGAIVEYILARHGGGRLVPGTETADFAPYLYWFHFANGTLQLGLSRLMWLNRLGLPAEHEMLRAMRGRVERAFGLVEARLGAAAHFAGDALTAADIMMVFSLTTMRLFQPVDLAPYPHIRGYLQRIGARPAYQRAMAKGDPGFAPRLA